MTAIFIAINLLIVAMLLGLLSEVRRVPALWVLVPVPVLLLYALWEQML
jgi:hypothetical protein